MWMKNGLKSMPTDEGWQDRWDLHVHSHWSDGSDSPEQLAAWARRQGLEGIALTDHDTLAGVPEMERAGRAQGLQVLAGFTGGFILGFPFMTLLCGIGSKRHSVLSALILGLAGLSVPHLLGILHYCGLTGLSFASSALVMSVPYLVKDVLSVGLAMSLGRMLRRRIAPLTLL